MKTSIFVLLLFPSMILGQVLIRFDQNMAELTKTKNEAVKLNFNIPTSIQGRQKILDIEFSVPPNKLVNLAGEYYAEYEGKTLAEYGEINIKSTLILYRNDLYSAKKRNELREEETNLKLYLKKEPNLELNNISIITTAQNLKSDNVEATVKNIFNFVTDHLEYHNFRIEDRGALKALKQKKGDCTEYTELMIALCRANDIPARYVYGIVTSPYEKENVKHNWVEVYFTEYGWVAFDPTFADSEYGKTSFEKMLNKYIYLNFSRNGKRAFLLNLDYPQHSKYKSSFSAVNYVDEYYKRISKLYMKKAYSETQILCDSLIDAEILDYRIYNVRASLHLKKNELELALTDLQLAIKNCYFEEDRAAVLFTFTKYYNKIREYGIAIGYLKKAIDLGYTIKYSEILMIMEDEEYYSLRTNKEFKEISRVLNEEYKYASGAYSPFLFGQNNNYLQPSFDCVLEQIPFEENDLRITLSKSLIESKKIKKLRIIREFSSDRKQQQNEAQFFEEYSFSQEGLLLNWTSQYNDHKFGENYFYDKENRQLKTIQWKSDSGRDTTFESSFYIYEDECLTQIKRCFEKCSVQEAKPEFKFDSRKKNQVVVSLFNDKGKERMRKFYVFDKANRMLSCTNVVQNDTTSITWKYSPSTNQTTMHINRELKTITKMNRAGLVIETSSGEFQKQMRYNSKNQIAKTTSTYQNSYKGVFHYDYNKDGLQTSTTFINKNNKNSPVVKNITYEFYQKSDEKILEKR